MISTEPWDTKVGGKCSLLETCHLPFQRCLQYYADHVLNERLNLHEVFVCQLHGKNSKEIFAPWIDRNH